MKVSLVLAEAFGLNVSPFIKHSPNPKTLYHA